MSILLLALEKGSLSAAARQLRMPLPTVSRKVSELEKHLGARLLVRTTRKLAPTDAGVAYVEAARRILEQVEEAERHAAGEYNAPRGELVLTAPLHFGRKHLLPVITEFMAVYPEIKVRLLLSDRNLQLVEEHVDMAVRIGTLPDSSLVATNVGTMRTVVCASPAFLATHGNPKTPSDLAAVPTINFDLQSAASAWAFLRKSPRRPFDVTVQSRLSVSTAEAAVGAAIDGLGVTRVLHYQCADEVRDGMLEIVLSDFELEPVAVQLLHSGRALLPTKSRVFLDFATGQLRERLFEINASEDRVRFMAG
jgi:DNA-binding transcriptional LysR family regulator